MITLGDKVLISDPCYSLGVWCTCIIDNVKPGKYESKISYWSDTDSFFNNRVDSLGVVEESYIDDYEYLDWQFYSDSIGVDSAQCGIFDYSSLSSVVGTGTYDDKSSFYGKICQGTSSDKKYTEYESCSVISQSGVGDGCYDLFIAKNEQDQVIAIKVVFLSEDESEDEEI